jgi:hypothetical protein
MESIIYNNEVHSEKKTIEITRLTKQELKHHDIGKSERRNRRCIWLGDEDIELHINNAVKRNESSISLNRYFEQVSQTYLLMGPNSHLQ